MGYDKNNTDPSGAAGEPNATGASSSRIDKTTWPYVRHADSALPPNILLRPPDGPDAAADPLVGAMQNVDDSIQRLERTTRLLSAPWIIEPPDSESFHKGNGILIPAVDGLFHEIVRIVCPPGRNGVIREIANVIIGGGFSDFSIPPQFTWQIVRNPGTGLTTAERNYEAIQASYGAINAPTKISAIRIFENDVIAFVGQNFLLPVAGESVAALLGGWFYPRTWDDQFDRQDKSISW